MTQLVGEPASVELRLIGSVYASFDGATIVDPGVELFRAFSDAYLSLDLQASQLTIVVYLASFLEIGSPSTWFVNIPGVTITGINLVEGDGSLVSSTSILTTSSFEIIIQNLLNPPNQFSSFTFDIVYTRS